MAIQPFNPSSPGNPNDRKKTGTGFTNINRIMQASQGNRLGQAVGGGVSGQASQAKAGLQQAKGTFGQESQANRLDTEENKQKVQEGMSAAERGEDINEGIAKSFEKFRGGQYTGPTQLGNETQVVNQAQQAQNLGSLSGTSGGRQALLQRFVGGAGYSQGKQRLDNLLLGQSGGQELRDARRQSQGLGQAATSAAEAARQNAQYLSNQAKAFGEDVKGQLGSTIGAQGEALTKQAEQANIARDAKVKALQEGGWKTEGLTDAEIDAIGLNPESRIYNEDIGKYIQRSDLLAGRGNVASDKDYGKAYALKKLSGQDLTEQGKSLLADLQDRTQAGAFDKDVGIKNTNKEALLDALSRTEKSYYGDIGDESYKLGQVANWLQNAKTADIYKTGVPDFQEGLNKFVGREGAGKSYQDTDFLSGLDNLQQVREGFNNPLANIQDTLNTKYGDYATQRQTLDDQLKAVAAANPLTGKGQGDVQAAEIQKQIEALNSKYGVTPNVGGQPWSAQQAIDYSKLMNKNLQEPLAYEKNKANEQIEAIRASQERFGRLNRLLRKQT